MTTITGTVSHQLAKKLKISTPARAKLVFEQLLVSNPKIQPKFYEIINKYLSKIHPKKIYERRIVCVAING